MPPCGRQRRSFDRTLANAHDVTLIHFDAGFEIAAEVLPFPHHWVPERGTI
jgi:hypothetical protein